MTGPEPIPVVAVCGKTAVTLPEVVVVLLMLHTTVVTLV